MSWYSTHWSRTSLRRSSACESRTYLSTASMNLSASSFCFCRVLYASAALLVFWLRSLLVSPPIAALRSAPTLSIEEHTFLTIGLTAFMSARMASKSLMFPAASTDMSTSASNWLARVCITVWATTSLSLYSLSLASRSCMLLTSLLTVLREKRLDLAISPLVALVSTGQLI